MNIWTPESKPGVIKPKITPYQCATEEGLANSIYAYKAYRHHGIYHMFESAVINLFFIPFEKEVKNIQKGDVYPTIIEVTQNDLDLFKIHGAKFLICLGLIEKILESKMTLSLCDFEKKDFPETTIYVLKISLV